MVKPSPLDEVLNVYEQSADEYEAKMDAYVRVEPIYPKLLEKIMSHLSSTNGDVLDVPCGPGHMLELLETDYKCKHKLIGTDISPKMLQKTKERVSSNVTLYQAEMSKLNEIPDQSCAAVINLFSVHHTDPKQLAICLKEWRRVLVNGGLFVFGTWEGSGPVNYLGKIDLISRRYTQAELLSSFAEAGFEIESCTVEPVERREMDVVYIVAYKS